uniref:DUF2599 domain-containing protein n=1 Tax=Cellulomonas fimi TaxID=1708 RepID=UPI0035ADEDAE
MARGSGGSRTATSPAPPTARPSPPRSPPGSGPAPSACSPATAPDKARWNLEPWRPEVDAFAMIAARCNPE